LFARNDELCLDTSPIILTTKLASEYANTERKDRLDDFRKAKAEPDYDTSIGIKY
jgi:hypothetical protein